MKQKGPSVKDVYALITSLKKIKRKGWLIRDLNADSLAEHVFGASVIGWYLAQEEGVDPQKVVETLILHDLVMAKMEDVTPVTGGYKDKRKMEEEAKMEVAKALGKKAGVSYLKIFDEYNERKTKVSIVAGEANKLESLYQGEAFEEETGRKDVLVGKGDFFEVYSGDFRTETGKKLFQELKERQSKRKNG